MKKEIVFHKEYENFIKNLSLKELKLTSVSASVQDDFSPPANLRIKDTPEYEEIGEKQILVSIKYHLEAIKQGAKSPGLIIDAHYTLLYTTEIPMTREFFEIFKQSSLRLQTWPYFRQIVHQITLEMHLPPLILDTIKVPI